MAVGGNTVYTSQDGKTWASQRISVPQYINGVTYGNNQFMVVGDMQAIRSLHSDSTLSVKQFATSKHTSLFGIRNRHNTVSITLPLEAADIDQLKVELYSVAGKRIYAATMRALGRNISVPVSEIPAGKYVVRVSDSQGNMWRAVFLKIK
jgi:hypothetical protein